MTKESKKQNLLEKIKAYLMEKIINNDKLSDDQKAHKVIVYSSCFCAIIACQPLPFADIFILTPIQMLMALLISKIRDKTDQTDKKSMDKIKELFEEMGLVILGGQLAQHSIITLYKIGLPVLGGFMTLPLVFIFTYAMGKVFDFYFCTLKQKNLEESKKDLNAKLQHNKKVLTEVFKKSKKEAKQIWEKLKKDRKAIYQEIKKIFKDKNLSYWEKLKKAVEFLAEKIGSATQ